MPEDDELARRVRKLVVEHAETRWFTLRLDNDVQEIRETLREHTTRFDTLDQRLEAVNGRLDEHEDLLREHSGRFDAVDRRLDAHEGLLREHSGRFDSVDAQLRSLTQLVGQVLERLPDERAG